MRPLHHRRRLSALLAAGLAAVAVALPAAAHAASASYAGGTIDFTAARGEANHLTIAPYGLWIELKDTGTAGPARAAIALATGPGCWRVASNTALCPATATLIHADLGDGSDTFDASLSSTPLDVTGGPGDDALTGGSGPDHLDGGPGNDTFEARDGAIDTLTCGSETDGGHADAGDSVASDCEAIAKPAVTPPEVPGVVQPDPSIPAVVDPAPDPSPLPAPADPQPVSPAANSVPATIPPQTVGVSASGVAAVKVVCPADSGGCSGTVVIEIPQPQGIAGKHKPVAVIAPPPRALQAGKARFTAKAGTAPTIHVRLSKRGRQRILRGRRRHARIVVTTRRADGTTTTATQDVTIAPSRGGKARGRR